jgi:hypothetical protein
MAVIKLTKSGKGVMFIDDSGNVFITSLVHAKNYLDGNIKREFIDLKRMPVGVAPERFGQSVVFGVISDDVITNADELSTDKANKDIFSPGVKKEKRIMDVVLDA